MGYQLELSNSIALDGDLTSSVTTLTPNSLIGVEFRDTSSDTHTTPADFTFADVVSTAGSEAGVQAIILSSTVNTTITFRDSSDNSLLQVIVNNETKMGFRSDSNLSLPLNFAIPNSGTVAKIEAAMTNVDPEAIVKVSVYYNRPTVGL